MAVIEKFLGRAGECRRIAGSTHDRETKAAWNRMADRWLALAENEKARSLQLSDHRFRRVRTVQRRRAA